MKRILFISIFPFLASQVTGQNCMTLFSYGASFETVQFFNQSEMSNAHYWWNFGDGTGSYYDNPVHTYPENGRYLVTLFAKDTVSNCSDYHELWLNVTKYSTDTCEPAIVDSVAEINGEDRIWLMNNSVNCNDYSSNYDGGPMFNFQSVNGQLLSDWWGSARFLYRIQYYDWGGNGESLLMREAYKNVIRDYESATNYGHCSANFEFTVVSADSVGQEIFFKAMNGEASSYDWYIPGFGNPIHYYTDTFSFFFPFEYNDLQNIGLTIEEANGCSHTVTQQLLVRKGLETTVGIAETGTPITNVRVYPNPFTEVTTLKFENSKRIKHRLTLFNSTGQVVKSAGNIISGQVTIDRGNLAGGIYFYQLQNNIGQTATGKLIVN